VRAPSTQAEREHRLGIVVGALVILVAGLAWYPPVVFGGICGGGLGVGLARGRSDDGATGARRVLLGVGASLALLVALGELLGTGIAGERQAFLAAWGANGPLDPELSALLARPWGWLPQTIAIGALSAAATLALERMR
jgi:hypothetical protein